MSGATTKNAIAEALSVLRKDHFEKFCFCLHDQREGPRVTRADLGDQSVGTISDLLVSKFCAAKAAEVAIDLLREITCNSAADVLGECRCLPRRARAIPKLRFQGLSGQRKNI